MRQGNCPGLPGALTAITSVLIQRGRGKFHSQRDGGGKQGEKVIEKDLKMLALKIWEMRP